MNVVFVPWHLHMRPVRHFTGHAVITLRIINASSKSGGVGGAPLIGGATLIQKLISLRNPFAFFCAQCGLDERVYLMEVPV